MITLADFEHFTGINVGSARVALRKHCLRNIDFFLLIKSELRAFKLENNFSDKLMNSLIAITKSGVEKLLKYYGSSTEIPMIEEKKQPPAKIKEPSSFIRPSSAMESLMSYIQREARAIDGVANMLLCPDTKENYESYRDLLIWRIKDLRNYCSDIELIKI